MISTDAGKPNQLTECGMKVHTDEGLLVFLPPSPGEADGMSVTLELDPSNQQFPAS